MVIHIINEGENNLAETAARNAIKKKKRFIMSSRQDKVLNL